MNLDIGAKVVCVDGKFPIGIEKLYDQLPVKDQTYVIRDLQMGICLDCKTGTVSVLLVGIVNPKADSKANLERGFHPDRFRPLEEMRVSETASYEISNPVGDDVMTPAGK